MRVFSEKQARKRLIASSVLVLFSLGGGWALWSFATGTPPAQGNTSPVTDTGAACDYLIRMAQNEPIATQRATGTTLTAGPHEDFGEFFTRLISSDKVFCVASGIYPLASEIAVTDKKNATLFFEPGVRVIANHSIRLLHVVKSSNILVAGGTWVATPGFPRLPGLEIDNGSNHVTIRGTDVSHAGRDGILIRNDTVPNLEISIINNSLHGNGRYGVQDFEHFAYQSLRILISGNTAYDNGAGGIYTNGVGGAVITSNTVRNSFGTTPGRIGIGVTNGENDTVTNNIVDHMLWYGIQAFYNNHTTITNNFSGFNAGGSDQSGITNDHSFFDTILNNTVISNGLAGVHVERSWFVTVQGNDADGNGRFGIEFYHGDIAYTSQSKIIGNSCSHNGQAGIILNSGVDTIISGNTCLDNSESGIVLYNDVGETGSSHNVVTHNVLGDDRNQTSQKRQLFGIRELNQADGNMITDNAVFGNMSANILASGPSTMVKGNVEDSPQ